jgi:hypothetical protein
VETLPSAAEAGIILAALFGTAEAVPFPVKIKINGESRVKRSGQECPLHTSKGNIKIKVKGDGQERPPTRSRYLFGSIVPWSAKCARLHGTRCGCAILSATEFPVFSVHGFRSRGALKGAETRLRRADRTGHAGSKKAFQENQP